jgi:dUTP pyrophosphatase
MAQFQQQQPQPYMYTLYVYVNQEDCELFSLYNKKVNSHNEQLLLNSFVDSGFDLFVPKTQTMVANKVNKVDFEIKCEMVKHVGTQKVPSAFYLYPRSSISKGNLRLANSVGIIDSGYRGNIIGMFDVIYNDHSVFLEAHSRILQICTPTLEPFKVVIVHSDRELSSTPRNTGGFGSTGV